MGEPAVNQNNQAQGGAGKRIVMFGSLVLVVLIVILLFVFGVIPLPSFGGGGVSGKYVVLYQNMDLKDAAAVVESLNSAGFKDYQLRDGGKTVLINRKVQDQARISLASEGIPAGGVVGFEIFDKGGQLGATDFDKRIKLTRALSGELSRNISRIYGIEDAKVQIVIPEKSMFATEKVPVTAAVFLKLRPGFLLSPQQVTGIRALVASSVEDAKQENITVVDYNGKVLSSDDYRRNYKRYLAEMQRSSSQKGGFFKKMIGSDDKNNSTAATGGSLSLAYQKLKTEKKSPQNGILDKLKGRKSLDSMSPKELAKFKFKFKKQYEQDSKEKTEYILSQFFPKNSYKVKVNVDLNNLVLDEKKDANSLINRLTLVILLDSNNNQINLTPEIKEAVFKAIAASVGYVRGRDRIELRFAPMIANYSKGSGLFSKVFKSSSKVESAISNEKQSNSRASKSNSKKNSMSRAKEIESKVSPHFLVSAKMTLTSVFGDKRIWAGGGGLLLLMVLFRKKKKPLIPEASHGKNSLFDDISDDNVGSKQAASAVDDIRSEVGKDPEKIAALLQKWWQDENG